MNNEFLRIKKLATINHDFSETKNGNKNFEGYVYVRFANITLEKNM